MMFSGCADILGVGSTQVGMEDWDNAEWREYVLVKIIHLHSGGD